MSREDLERVLLGASGEPPPMDSAYARLLRTVLPDRRRAEGDLERTVRSVTRQLVRSARGAGDLVEVARGARALKALAEAAPVVHGLDPHAEDDGPTAEEVARLDAAMLGPADDPLLTPAQREVRLNELARLPEEMLREALTRRSLQLGAPT